MIELCGISKTYHAKVHALCNVDFSVFQNEYVAVTGRSGAGKSTLLHMLGLLETPSTGQRSLLGRDVSAKDDAELSALRGRFIGFVFQSFYLIDELSVWENVALPFQYISSYEFPDKDKAVSGALSEVGLSKRSTHRPGELSGGEAQRAAIARALVMRPKLLLADEPTGNLDRTTGGEILELFDTLHVNGTAIVVVTHDPMVAQRARQVVRLEDGMLVKEDG